MVAHPEKKLLWWLDSDMVFTEMLFKPPWGTYARHNLLIHGWDEAVYDTKNWLDRHQRRQLRHQELPVVAEPPRRLGQDWAVRPGGREVREDLR
jgi:hypothetical protein